MYTGEKNTVSGFRVGGNVGILALRRTFGAMGATALELLVTFWNRRVRRRELRRSKAEIERFRSQVVSFSNSSKCECYDHFLKFLRHIINTVCGLQRAQSVRAMIVLLGRIILCVLYLKTIKYTCFKRFLECY